jgi:hypothetical protein
MIVLNIPPWRSLDPTQDHLGRTHDGYRPGMTPVALYYANLGAYVISEDRVRREKFALFAIREENFLIRLAVEIDRIEIAAKRADDDPRDHRRMILGRPLGEGHPIHDTYVGQPSPLGPRNNPVGYYDSPLDDVHPCQCGCGEVVKGLPFKRGHEQTALHQRVKEIGTVADFIQWFDRLRDPFKIK